MSKKSKKVELTEEMDTIVVSENKENTSNVITETKETGDNITYANDPSLESVPALKVEEKTEEKEDNSKEEIKRNEKIENELEERIEGTTSEPTVEVQPKEPFEVVTSQKKSHKTLLIVSISFVFILLLFFLFSTVFALVANLHSTIISGIHIKDVDVSGLTKEQALEKVLTAFEEKITQSITLKHNEYETTVFPEQLDVSFALEEAVDVAYSKGRSRKYFSK